MSKYIFLFDLDSTITKEEILPKIAKEFDISEKMIELTESTMRGEVPFKQSFLNRVDLLRDIPVSRVQEIVANIELNNKLVEFIQKNKHRCYIVTGNLDIWIKKLVERMEMSENVYCSKASVVHDRISEVVSVLDKEIVVKQMILPLVAVGDGNNDAAMIDNAEIGIGYGGVRPIAPAVLECASHAFYNENRMVEFLERLL